MIDGKVAVELPGNPTFYDSLMKDWLEFEELFDWRWLHMHKPSEGVQIENVTADFGTSLELQVTTGKCYPLREGENNLPPNRRKENCHRFKSGPAGRGYVDRSEGKLQKASTHMLHGIFTCLCVA